MNFVYAKATLASTLKQRDLALWCCVGLAVTNMGLAFKLMGTEEHWVLMPQYQDEHRPEKLQHVCARIKPGYLTTVQTKVLEQGLGLLENGLRDDTPLFLVIAPWLVTAGSLVYVFANLGELKAIIFMEYINHYPVSPASAVAGVLGMFCLCCGLAKVIFRSGYK